MALVSVGWELLVNLVDTSGSVSTLQYSLTSADYATAQVDAAAILAELDPLTNSNISGFRLVEVTAEDAFTLPSNAENAIKARVSVFLDTLGNKRAYFNIPAPAIGLFVSGSGEGYNIVDTSDTDLLQYVALFEATGQATISDGEHVRSPASTAIDKGRRVSVKSSNP